MIPMGVNDAGQPIVVQLMLDGRMVTEVVTDTLMAEGPEAKRHRTALTGRA